MCVDVETAGPVPGRYAMLSIGACLVEEPETSFYVELQPDREDYQEEALAVSGLVLERLLQEGHEPRVAMGDFADWLLKVVPEGKRAVFTALNAPFDWMFVCDYFERYLGYNPFGHSALDIKAYYMGWRGCAWKETSMRQISGDLFHEKHLVHNALRDAQDQAEIFREILRRATKEG